MKIVRLSSKGQVSIPKDFRSKIKVGFYMIQMQGQNIVLTPIKIKVLASKKDETQDFGRLAEKSFSFWDNKEDDVYSNFYK